MTLYVIDCMINRLLLDCCTIGTCSANTVRHNNVHRKHQYAVIYISDMSSMDVDQHIDIRPPTPNPAPNENLAKTDEKPLLVVNIDDAHPFDLETYVSGYSGTYENTALFNCRF